MTFRPRLLVLFNLVDGDNDLGLANFYRNYRALAVKPGFDNKKYRLPDLLADYVGAPTNRDLTACLEAFQLDVSDDLKAKFKKENRKAANFVCAVVPEDKFKEAVPKLAANHRLASLFNVVTNEDVAKLGYKGDLTVNIKRSKAASAPVKLKLIQDGKEIESVDVKDTDTQVKFTNKTTGTYDLQAVDAKGNNVGETNYVAIRDKDSKADITIKTNANDVDKTKLQKLYDDVANTSYLDYTTDSFTNFKDALDNAKKVLDETNATQTQIDDAYEKLDKAYKQLVKVADKTALKNLIDEVSLTKAQDYTQDSWNKLKQKFDKANNVYKDKNATQEVVDQTYNELKTAYDNLVAIKKADKTALGNLIDKVNNTIKNDGSKYTEESIKALETVNNEAVKVYNDPKATQEQVDEVTKCIRITETKR